VAAYCAGRFWIELLRIDTAERFLGLRLNVFTAVIVFLLAVAYLLWQRGRPREVLARGADDGGTGVGAHRARAAGTGTPTDGGTRTDGGTPTDGAAVGPVRSRTARGAGADAPDDGREPPA
jgi:hypothetical protein